MADLRGFDASQHDELRSFEALPAGKYNVAMVASELKDTKNGNNKGLNCTFQILDGEYKGRQLFAWLNLQHSNADAVRIAQMELASICKAVGVLTPKDSAELHDKPIVVSVKQETRKDTGAVQNRISGYFSRLGTPAPAAKPAAQAAAPGWPAQAPYVRQA